MNRESIWQQPLRKCALVLDFWARSGRWSAARAGGLWTVLPVRHSTRGGFLCVFFPFSRTRGGTP